jgi:lipoprotein signal peptidase
MSNAVQIVLLLAGLALLVVGYRRDHRRMLAAAAIVLVLAGAMPDFIDGLAHGWSASQGFVAR